MGKNMPAGKATRFSAEMAAHLMDNAPNLTSENDDDSYVTAASTSTSEIRMGEQLVDTIKKDWAKSKIINEPTTHQERTHRASESNDQQTSKFPIVGARGSCERREARVKLKIHDRKKYNASVILVDNRNEFGQWGIFGFLKVGSVIRLHLEETFLLVVNQIVSNKEFFGIHSNKTQSACISIAHDHLPSDLYRPVQNVEKAQAQIMVEHVPPEELCGKDGSQLDNVQLYFKELYLSRADMWKMRKALIGKTLFQDRDIVSSVLNVNLRISDMWRRGEQVRHGYVSADTRVVFRSSSSMVLIYLQVSEEMFHMDGTGHMLFETCTAGFLSALLQQWEHSNCSHYVSIIMCSRWFFDQSPSAEDIQRENLVPDQQGRYYQDFYKLLVQNEHYEDWVTPFSKILHIFYDYRDIISAELGRNFPDLPANNYHISVADDGNFLPSLNMSMNMFCMYHSDRRYETTGQEIIYVTAGYGVFNVDENAVQPTKQKLIDMGISLDMVCLGQQPLHVTPLFIFHDREGQVYKHYTPHWMNYSYFRMDGKKPTLATFTPRVILPQDYTEPTYEHLSMVEADDVIECEESEKEDSEVNSGIDKTRAHMARLLDAARRKVNGESTDTETDRETEQTSSRASLGSSLCSLDEADGDGEGFDLSRYGNHRRASDLDLELEVEKNELEEGMSSTDRTTFMQLLERVSPINNVAQNSSDLLEKELNPDPVPAALGSISQRVPHVHRFSSISGVPQQRERSIGASSLEGAGVTFDLRRGGSSLESSRGRVSSMTRASQAHSYHTTTQNQLQPNVYSNFPFKPDSHVVMTANRRRWIHVFPMDVRGMSKLAHHYVQGRSTINIVDIEEPPSSSHRQIPIQGQTESPLRRAASPQAGGIHQGSPGRVAATSPLEPTSQRPPRAWAWAWGSTGEEKWNPDLTIGMDWKSLIRSALLPITTDFFPEGFTIRNQYRVHGHQVLVDHSLIEDIDIPDVKSLTLSELSHLVFDLLISQRLQRGFQIVTLSRRLIKSSVAKAGRFPQDEGSADDDVTLTFSNIYHRLVRRRNDIYVTLLIPDPNRKQFEVAKPGESRVSRRPTNNTIAPSQESQIVSNDRTFENTQYQYYFQVPDAERYEKSTTSFKPHNLDKLNWSLLDTKLTYRSKDELKGYSQLFKDEMKSYSSRFMVVAQSLDPDRAALIVQEKLPGETFRERAHSQRAIYGDFTKFLLGLNK
ncbi:unnamed protein product, partial [Mesorhabditis belari]|uniref:DEP domain-containing protein 5 n=1 Tax=Mesorhabditis belari TaxID=2138241 RepID=A0AAF3J1H0_9BILA